MPSWLGEVAAERFAETFGDAVDVARDWTGSLVFTCTSGGYPDTAWIDDAKTIRRQPAALAATKAW